jgi:hypothetical protein
MNRVARLLLLLALLFGVIPARAVFVTNDFRSPGGGSNTIIVSFQPTSTYYVWTNGTIIYTDPVSATATNGILSPTWLAGGNYTVTVGPRFDKFTIGVPFSTNSSSLWMLITNSVLVTNIGNYPLLGVAAGTNVTTQTNGNVVTVNATSGGAGGLLIPITTYGADPSGILDSTVAIQLTVDAAEATPGYGVGIPGGTFNVNGTPIVNVSNLLIQGVGQGALVGSSLGPSIIQLNSTSGFVFSNAANQLIVQNVGFIDTNIAAAMTGGAFITGTNSNGRQQTTPLHCYFIGGYIGLDGRVESSANIYDDQFSEQAYCGMFIDNGAAPDEGGDLIHDCLFTHNSVTTALADILMWGAGGTKIYHNTMVANGGNGAVPKHNVYLHWSHPTVGSTEIDINNCTLDSSGQDAILTDNTGANGAGGGRVTGMKIYDNTFSSYYTNGGGNVTQAWYPIHLTEGVGNGSTIGGNNDVVGNIGGQNPYTGLITNFVLASFDGITNCHMIGSWESVPAQQVWPCVQDAVSLDINVDGWFGAHYVQIVDSRTGPTDSTPPTFTNISGTIIQYYDSPGNGGYNPTWRFPTNGAGGTNLMQPYWDEFVQSNAWIFRSRITGLVPIALSTFNSMVNLSNVLSQVGDFSVSLTSPFIYGVNELQAGTIIGQGLNLLTNIFLTGSSPNYFYTNTVEAVVTVPYSNSVGLNFFFGSGPLAANGSNEWQFNVNQTQVSLFGTNWGTAQTPFVTVNNPNPFNPSFDIWTPVNFENGGNFGTGLWTGTIPVSGLRNIVSTNQTNFQGLTFADSSTITNAALGASETLAYWDTASSLKSVATLVGATLSGSTLTIASGPFPTFFSSQLDWNGGNGTNVIAGGNTNNAINVTNLQAAQLVSVSSASLSNQFLFNAGNGGVSGNYNVGLGALALQKATSGSDNTAIGTAALYLNTTFSGNTAVGFEALSNNLAANNTAVGSLALLVASTDAANNTAIGYSSLLNDSSGNNSTGIGYQSLNKNSTGNSNTAAGVDALFFNTTGSNNTAVGFDAGMSEHTGNYCVFIGANSGSNGAGNVLSGNNLIAIGYQAGSGFSGSESNNIAIGNPGNPGTNGTIWIGQDNVHTNWHIAGSGSTLSLVASNGIATLNTNILLAGAASSWNAQFATLAAGITNTYGTNMVFNYSGTSGTINVYSAGGLGGSTPAANLYFTGTVVAGFDTISLPPNWGVQITTGTGVTAAAHF